MKQPEDSDLPWYDLADLLEKHPNLFEMSEAELKQLFSDKYFDTQHHPERASVTENKENTTM